MILVIDNYDSFTYNLVQLIGQLGHEVLVRRNDAVTIDEIRELDPRHIVISPGPGRPEGAGCSVGVVREFHGRRPILGVCLGHQAIAVAAGGEVGPAERLMHGKLSEIHHDGRGIFRGLRNPFPAARYHSLAVATERFPPDLQVTARTAEGEIMAVRWRGTGTVGVQFHPESILTDEGPRLVANFLRPEQEPC